MAIHFKYGGSTAARLIQCPAHIQAIESIPKVDRSSPYAQRGTNLHNIQEKLRNEQLFPDELDISKIHPELTPAELLDYIETTELVYNLTDEVLDKYNINDYICEPLVKAGEDMGGSIDLLGYNKNTAVIIDYKMGYNQVDADNNLQGLFYFFATYMDKRFTHLIQDKKLAFVIIQPNQLKPNIYEFDWKRLNSFITEYMAAVKKSQMKDAPFNSGKECKFCKNGPYCHIQKQYAQRALYLTAKQKTDIEEALKLASMLDEWSKQVFSEAEAILKTGETINGFKLVEKQARKYWKDEKQLLNLINTLPDKDNYFEPPKVLTPAKVLKLVKKDDNLTKVFEDEIIKKSSGVTVVKDSDKRPSVITEAPENLKNLIKNK